MPKGIFTFVFMFFTVGAQAFDLDLLETEGAFGLSDKSSVHPAVNRDYANRTIRQKCILTACEYLVSSNGDSEPVLLTVKYSGFQFGQLDQYVKELENHGVRVHSSGGSVEGYLLLEGLITTLVEVISHPVISWVFTPEHEIIHFGHSTQD